MPILMHKAYDEYTMSLTVDEAPEAFENWCTRRMTKSPQFNYWYTTLEFELTILRFVRSRSWIGSFLGFLLLTAQTTADGYLFIYVTC